MPAPEPAHAVAALEARLAVLEQELASHRRRRRFGGVAVLLTLALGVGTAVAATGACPNDLPVCFAAGDPARATQLNQNFAQLLEWLEAKVGTRGQNVAVSTPASFGSTVGVTGATSLNGTLTVAGALSANGRVVYSGFQTSCSEGDGSSGAWANPWCCRVNVRTGATTCRLATSTTSWSTAGTDPFPAGAEGRYGLACFGGIPNINFPGCCLTEEISGTVSCRFATQWNLSAWAAPVSPAF